MTGCAICEGRNMGRGIEDTDLCLTHQLELFGKPFNAKDEAKIADVPEENSGLLKPWEQQMIEKG